MKSSSTEYFTKLVHIVGAKHVSTDPAILSLHAKDKSFHKPVSPDLVVWPKNSDEVSAILTLANNYKIPVTAWGGGSSLEGNPIPTKKGIVMNMTRMNKIQKITVDDLTVIVGPGIIGDELDAKLKPYGLWFAAAPGSKHIATIGGMIANNAGGMNAVKYGVIRESVLQLEVVLATGEKITLGSKSYKSVSGYDLKDVFIGSEGTLGIITNVVLKLNPLPVSKMAVLVSFPDDRDAANLTGMLLKSNIKPASIEYMDQRYISLINKAKDITLLEQPTVLVELHGDTSVLLQQLKMVTTICKKNRATQIAEFITEKQINLLWSYRKAVRPIISTLLPNKGVLSAEIGVPISKIPALLSKIKTLAKKFSVEAIVFGHMGDGNFHAWALYDIGNPSSFAKVQTFNEVVILYAIKLGGTTTGEHGLGIGKSKFLPVEHPSTLPYMLAIKRLFDPNGILNPGKMFP